MPRRWNYALALILGSLALCAVSHAQTYTVLYSFQGKQDGLEPYGGVIRDNNGNLYGVNFAGVIYEISPSGMETTLHTLTYNEGQSSLSSLLFDRGGNLYGTAAEGSILNEGTVFVLTKTGNVGVLWAFGKKGPHKGFAPESSLIRDDEGNLYGTAGNGGSTGGGTVFRIDRKTGMKTVLYSFGFNPDGNFPTAPVMFGANGDLYGTTEGGGTAGYGTIYDLDPTGAETILYEFGGPPDGASPVAGLVRDSEGNFYGTTAGGGTNNQGTVYKFDRRTGALTILHSFGENPSDGVEPFGGVVADPQGNLYGTTYLGGTSGYGTVFRLDPSGTVTILHSFTGQEDGKWPYSGVTIDADSNLYGTTIKGGQIGYGAVFEVLH
ncbi:MAG: hypothetical protein H0X25_05355 [Acidobacteriales bacterium]|nr:hypothetical protein [Terriglobales bacterium]